MPTKTIEEVLEENRKGLLSLSKAVGTGQGLCEGRPCIKIYVVRKSEELHREIPATLGGYRVVVEETEKIKALPR